MSATIPSDLEAVKFGAYERVVLALVAAGGDALEVLDLSHAHSAFRMKRSLTPVQIAVVRFLPGAAAETEALLRTLAKSAGKLPLDLVLVGGGPAEAEQLRRAVPFYTPARVGLVHIGDEDWTWSQKPVAAGNLLLPFEERASGIRADRAAWDDLLARSAADLKRAHAQRAELMAFVGLVNRRRPVATWSIALFIAAMFGVELWLGGPGSPPVLVRLGAVVTHRIAAGEWWRLVAGSFLHGGFLHVALNLYVLLILGQFLERIIGPARFLVLYAASALAGGLGSALLLKAELSVGASGAVWGLLGAHAILAYRPQGLLPAALIPGARRAALINLGINIVNSFQPQVDLWAHFAGGLAGALLFATGLFTLGLPRLGAIEAAGGDPAGGDPAIPTGPHHWALAALAGLVLLAGPIGAFAWGRPFGLTDAVVLHPVAIEELGVRVSIPDGLVRSSHDGPSGTELSFGDLLADPMLVGLYALLSPPLAADERAAQIKELERSHALPQDTKLLTPATAFARGDAPGLSISFAYPSGLVYERAFLYLPLRLLRVDVLRWPGLPRSAPAGLARRIAESAEEDLPDR